MDNLYIFLDFIKINIETNSIIMFFIFFIFLLFYNTFSLPGNLVFIVSTGYFFGVYLGFLISILSLVFGSLIFFIFSKLLLKKYFYIYYEKYSNKAKKYIGNSSVEYLIIFRMIPGPPLILQNFCLSILNIKKTKFIFTSLIGFSPLVFTAVMIGNQINNIEKLKKISLRNIFSLDFMIIIIFLTLILVIHIIYKRKKINS